MLRRILLSVLVSAAGAVHAQAGGRIPVTDVRELLVGALDSPAGSVSGVLAGPFAQAIAQHFRTAAPLLVDITTLERYAQPGCARLNVRMQQDGVRLGDEPPQQRTIDFGLDYCRDGTPPRSPEKRR